jgi:LPS export ABC transporter protein LptC
MRGARTSLRPLALAACAAALGACESRQPPPVKAQPTIADSADQVLFGVGTSLYANGLRTGELIADTIFVFDQNNRYELRVVRSQFFSATGQLQGTLTSEQGTYNLRTGIMEARGNAVLKTTDGRQISSPELRYIIHEQLIRSDSSFVMVKPGERVTGVGFTTDPNLRTLKIDRVLGATGSPATVPGS